MLAKDYLTSIFETVVKDMGYPWPEKVTVEPPKDKKFGDFAVNCALVLAKQAGKSPRELATLLADGVKKQSAHIASVDIAGPGFLNVVLSQEFWHGYIPAVEKAAEGFGSSSIGLGKKVQVEFVSANPTGPLHIGHGRGAAIGDSVVRILRFNGFEVQAEYYLNDAGNQMNTLGRSIWLRLLEIAGKSTAPFPADCYQGEYIADIARELLNAEPNILEMPEDKAEYRCYQVGMEDILTGIKDDLLDFRVVHDRWFSEKSLVDNGKVEETLLSLQKSGHAYEKDGALWFNTTALGDDKDRVLRKSDGSLTYFASDVAYHASKYERGFDLVIDVWGADHHGYIPRMQAAVESLGKEKNAFAVILVQLVNLLRDGEQIAMSTRAGQFETLADVVGEVGVDAARFIFLSRKSDSKLDFDLALVKQRTMENPVYYVQYAHARVKAVFRRAEERGIVQVDNARLELLVQEEELALLRMLDKFSQVVQEAGINHAPHYISYYLMELAGLLHKYYSVHQILGAESEALVAARLRLVRAIAQTIANGLNLLGVNAPEAM